MSSPGDGLTIPLTTATGSQAHGWSAIEVAFSLRSTRRSIASEQEHHWLELWMGCLIPAFLDLFAESLKRSVDANPAFQE